MKASRLLLALWFSTACFCALQIVFGPGGITETQKLERQKALLDVRLADLQTENARLSARYEALKNSPEAVRLEARSLGYFQPSETPVRTLGGVSFQLPDDETHLSRIPPVTDENRSTSLFFRLAWPLLFLVFWGTFQLIPRFAAPQLPSLFGVDFFRK